MIYRGWPPKSIGRTDCFVAGASSHISKEMIELSFLECFQIMMFLCYFFITFPLFSASFFFFKVQFKIGVRIIYRRALYTGKYGTPSPIYILPSSRKAIENNTLNSYANKWWGILKSNEQMSQTSWLFSGFLNVAMSSIVQSRNVCLKNKGILRPAYCLAQFFCYVSLWPALQKVQFGICTSTNFSQLQNLSCLIFVHKPLVTIICSLLCFKS